jgi:hypothetical protein
MDCFEISNFEITILNKSSKYFSFGVFLPCGNPPVETQAEFPVVPYTIMKQF